MPHQIKSSKLPKIILSYDKIKDRWNLKAEKSDKIIKSFVTKEAATKRGILKRILGEKGGSVRIKKMNGVIQEERTYPREKDPSISKG